MFNFRLERIKNSLGNYVILTDGRNRIANIAILSDIEEVKCVNSLIKELEENNTDMYVINDDSIFKIKFKITSTVVSSNILISYVSLINSTTSNVDVFEFIKRNGKTKRIRESNSGGNFVSWYNEKEVKDKTIKSFDGIYICGKYLRVTNDMTDIRMHIFDKVNQGKPFCRIGSMFGLYTINGIIIPDIQTIISITPESVTYLDFENRKYTINAVYEREVYITA